MSFVDAMRFAAKRRLSSRHRMAEVVRFKPRGVIDADDHLKRFIDVCRNELTAFGTDLAFDENRWDVSEAVQLKARGPKSHAVFSNWAAGRSAQKVMMAEPFCSFAKAYFRYQHGLKPVLCIGPRLAALRALEAALTENGEAGNPTHIDAGVLNRAAQLIQERFLTAAAYGVGSELESLAAFISEHRLTIVPLPWRNPLRKPERRMRVGKAFDQRRHQRLPSPAALLALAKAFTVATEPADVLVTSVLGILCAAPSRLNEVLQLRTDCEVSEGLPNTRSMAYGLRWWASKGGGSQVKWIIPSMASVVQTAVARIRQQTNEARRIALWYERNPQSIYLPEALEHLLGRRELSLREVGDVLFAEEVPPCTPFAWCRRHGVAMITRGRSNWVQFADLEKAVLNLLPKGFPILYAPSGLRHSANLCLIQRQALHDARSPYRCAIEAVQTGHIWERLRQNQKSPGQSIFDRLGFHEDDGSPIRLKTHQLRHYLNTLAQGGGMSQLDIAKWSGRKNVQQNVTYDHISDRDMLSQIREAVGDGHRMVGPLACVPQNDLIPREEFIRLKIPTAHTTEVGFCVHDYTMSPCQLHRDCINCDELVCIKGDATKAAAIRRQYSETQTLLALALEAAGQKYSGADRWVEHQQYTVERLRQLCAKLDDPEIPDGTFIQLLPRKLAPALGKTDRAVLGPAERDQTTSDDSVEGVA
jgi:hypothetical protein